VSDFQFPARPPEQLPVFRTLRDALAVYRLLFARSVTVAAIVYAAIALLDIAHHAVAGVGAQAFATLSFVLSLAGPLIVQGALVAIVRNVHEGVVPEKIGALFGIGGARFWPLLGASILYALGVIGGLILFVIPGLIVLARWSLLAPLIVLEGRSVGEARRRSSALVRGQSAEVFCCIFLTYLVILAVGVYIALGGFSFATLTFLTFLWSAVTAPFTAHVLTVIYYRLADPDTPIIHPAVSRWRSIWDGA
jgi:hypothetical protein